MKCVQGITYNMLQRVIVCVYLILMTTQFVWIEGMNISPVKVACMSFSPVIFLIMLHKFKENFNVLVYVGIYLVMLVCCSLLSSSVVVWDRIFYRSMFLMTFICVYQIIYTDELSIGFFRRLLTFIVCLYGGDFFLQHLCFMVGIHEMPIINLTGAMTMVGGLKANGLAIEPSHAARILAFVYWGEIALTEIMHGRDMTLKEHFKENTWSSISFWGAMLLMGSATAMLGAALVAIHFFKRHIGIYLASIIIIIVFCNVDFNIESIDRLRNVVNAFFSDDTVQTLKEKEASGGSRIAPMINTLTQLDLFARETWVGVGTDHVREHLNMFTTQKIGDINDFGLISYIFSLLFVYKCCIRRFFCVETLLFAILLGFSIGSIYTCWGAMIVCTAIKYYSENYQMTTSENKE